MSRNLYRTFTQSTRTFARDRRGVVAVIFALAAVPILMGAAIALDMSVASEMKSEMQAAADAGVVAAATRLATNSSAADKEEIALAAFYANLSQVLADHAGTPDVDIDFPAKQVHMAVDIEQSSLLGGFADDAWNLHVEATATVSKGTAICMMALNPHAEEALSIQGTADLMATQCAVHVNSDDADNALHQHGSSTATAESFCVHGGHYGSDYTPTPEDKCWYENDPLAANFASDWSAEGISTNPAPTPICLRSTPAPVLSPIWLPVSIAGADHQKGHCSAPGQQDLCIPQRAPSCAGSGHAQGNPHAHPL